MLALLGWVEQEAVEMRGKLEKDGAAPEKLLGVLEALKVQYIDQYITLFHFSIQRLTAVLK